MIQYGVLYFLPDGTTNTLLEIKMISFKQFVNEAVISPWEVSPGKHAEAVKWLEANASEELKRGLLIYRGFDKSSGGLSSISFIDSSTGERTSTGSNNVYQLMMDSSTGMKDIPSRSKSFICSDDWEMARAYGKLYLMFPLKGTTVAVGSSGDYLVSTMIDSPLDSLAGKHASISELSKLIGSRLKVSDESRSSIDFKMTKDKLESHLSSMSNEQIWDAIRIPKDVQEGKLNKLVKSGRTAFEAFCDSYVTPESMSVEVHNYGSKAIPKDEREMWFSGKALVIQEDVFVEMLPALTDSMDISKYILNRYKVPHVNI